jgi:O-antigen/teichoic acid export membrane protein
MTVERTPSFSEQPSTAIPDAPDANTLVPRVAGSAFNLVSRFGLLTLLSGLSAIAITRLLGPTSFGQYASAIATWSVLGASADFGFSLMLTRDMTDDHRAHRPMLRAAYELAMAWSFLLTLVMVGLALSAGISSPRGMCLLVLAPSMAFNGLNPARAFFEVRYETRRLLIIDLGLILVQLAAMVTVAALGLGPVAVAGVVSVGSIVNNLAVSYVADRMLGSADGPRFSRVKLMRRAAPLGLMSIMTKVYLMLDLVILGWLVAGPALGNYAAASKLLTVLAGVSGVVMGGAIPALSRSASNRVEFEKIVIRVWHWLLVGVVPVFVALALFAPLIVRVTLGHKYVGSVPLVRILSLAGVISVVSNVVGSLMVVLHKTRALLVQNGAAIILNLVGNLLLVPRIGVSAAAWVTVATEIFVCTASILTLRRELTFHGCARISLRPGIALLGATATALALSEWPLVAGVVGAVVLVLLLIGLDAWPPEFRLSRFNSVS